MNIGWTISGVGNTALNFWAYDRDSDGLGEVLGEAEGLAEGEEDGLAEALAEELTEDAGLPGGELE